MLVLSWQRVLVTIFWGLRWCMPVARGASRYPFGFPGMGAKLYSRSEWRKFFHTFLKKTSIDIDFL